MRTKEWLNLKYANMQNHKEPVLGDHLLNFFHIFLVALVTFMKYYIILQ